MQRHAVVGTSSRTRSARKRRGVRLLLALALATSFLAIRGDALTQDPGGQAGSPQLPTPQLIASLNLLSFGLAPAVGLAGQCLAKHGTVEMILQALDQDRNGALTFEEVLGADLLVIARRLQSSLHCRAPAQVIDTDDRGLAALLRGHLQSLLANLNLGADELPAIQIGALRGDPQGLLRRATFRMLADLVANLETRAPSDITDPQFVPDMTGQTRADNDRLKAELMAWLDRLFPLVQAGLARPLREELLQLRALADGDPSVADVITPQAAGPIVFQIDSLASLPGVR